jgi:hypothetical protein
MKLPTASGGGITPKEIKLGKDWDEAHEQIGAYAEAIIRLTDHFNAQSLSSE